MVPEVCVAPGRAAVRGVADGAAVADHPAVAGVDEGTRRRGSGSCPRSAPPRSSRRLAAVRGVADEAAGAADDPAGVGVAEGHAVERRVVPEVWVAQVVPPRCCRQGARMVPPVPTTQPLLASVKQTARRFCRHARRLRRPGRAAVERAQDRAAVADGPARPERSRSRRRGGSGSWSTSAPLQVVPPFVV